VTTDSVETAAWPEPIRLAIICERLLIGRALHHALSAQPRLQLVHPCLSRAKAPRLLARLRPAVVLLDCPGASALPGLPELVSSLSWAQVIVLVEAADSGSVAEVLDAGARAFVLYEAGVPHLVSVVERVA
jgi:DNA-binding NarL/FixJ family response regulator